MTPEENMILPTPKLSLREVVPGLSLLSSKNKNVNVWDFRQRENLVIFFFHGVECSSCKAYLEELAKINSEVLENESEILAISFDKPETLKNLEEKIPFPLLFGINKDMILEYTYIDATRGSPFPSIFITDRYGVLRYQKIVREANDLPSTKDILDRLYGIEI
ncbi:MAG: hypothetical protein QG670_326, partial [Thermoproteota archaeon]|nr:hypothetical protein [Thermoproteota archaeon]